MNCWGHFCFFIHSLPSVFQLFRYFVMAFNMLYFMIGCMLFWVVYYLLSTSFPSALVLYAASWINVAYSINPRSVDMFVMGLVRGLYNLLLALSSAMIVTAVIGFVCLWLCFRLLLVVYVLTKLALAIAMYRMKDQLHLVVFEQLHTQMKQSFYRYKGDTDIDMDSIVWTLTQALLKCCGMESYHDYKGHPNFHSPSFIVRMMTAQTGVPVSCCLNTKSNRLSSFIECHLKDTPGCLPELQKLSDKFLEISEPLFVYLASFHLIDMSLGILLFIFTFKKYDKKLKPPQRLVLPPKGSFKKTHPRVVENVAPIPGQLLHLNPLKHLGKRVKLKNPVGVSSRYTPCACGMISIPIAHKKSSVVAPSTSQPVIESSPQHEIQSVPPLVHPEAQPKESLPEGLVDPLDRQLSPQPQSQRPSKASNEPVSSDMGRFLPEVYPVEHYEPYT